MLYFKCVILFHRPQNGAETDLDLSGTLGNRGRINSYGCLTDIRTQRDEREETKERDDCGDMTVRTEPAILLGNLSGESGDSGISSLSSGTDNNNNKHLDEKILSLALEKAKITSKECEDTERSLTPTIPLLRNLSSVYSTSKTSVHSYQEPKTDIKELISQPTPSPKKRISLSNDLFKSSPSVPPTNFRKGAKASPSFGSSASDHELSDANDKISSTKLFKSKIQRQRDQRYSQRHLGRGTNPTKKALPPLGAKLKKQSGQFYLAFPFNDATHTLSHGNLDIKMIIKEIQKQSQRDIKEIQTDFNANSKRFQR